MRIAACQVRPVLLDREATLARVLAAAEEAAAAGARLALFPETVLPGYPAWLARTDGAAFDDELVVLADRLVACRTRESLAAADDSRQPPERRLHPRRRLVHRAMVKRSASADAAE